MPNLTNLPDEALELIIKYLCPQHINNDLSTPSALLTFSSTCRRFRYKSIPFLASYLPFRTSSDWSCANAQYLTSFQYPMPLPVKKKIKQKSVCTTLDPSHMTQFSKKSTNMRRERIQTRTNSLTPVPNPELETLLNLLKLPTPPPLHTIDIDLKNDRLSDEVQHFIHHVAPTLKRFRLRCHSTSMVPQYIAFHKLCLKQMVFSLSLSGSNGWSSFIRSLRAVSPTCLRLFINGPLLGEFPSDLIKPLMKSVRRLELINDTNRNNQKGNEWEKKNDSIQATLSSYMNLVPLCDELEEFCVDGFDLIDENLNILQDYQVLLKLHKIEMRRISNKSLHQVLSTDLKRLVTIIEVTKEVISPRLVSMLPYQLIGLAVAVDESSLRALNDHISNLVQLKSLRIGISKTLNDQERLELLVNTLHGTIDHLQELRVTGCSVVDKHLIQFISDEGRDLRVFALQVLPFIRPSDFEKYSATGLLRIHRFQPISSVQNMGTSSTSVTRYEECDNTNMGWARDLRSP